MVWRELKKLDTEQGYRLRSLKPGLEGQVEALRRDIRSDKEVTLSSHREGFYDVVTPTAWYLVHSSAALRTIYLVAHAEIGGIKRPVSVLKPAEMAVSA